jgi:hypothetical protein
MQGLFETIAEIVEAGETNCAAKDKGTPLSKMGSEEEFGGK